MHFSEWTFCFLPVAQQPCSIIVQQWHALTGCLVVSVPAPELPSHLRGLKSSDAHPVGGVLVVIRMCSPPQIVTVVEDDRFGILRSADLRHLHPQPTTVPRNFVPLADLP